jgi:hypothetical protein
MKIDGVYCVYTIYLDNPTFGPPPVRWENLEPVASMEERSRKEREEKEEKEEDEEEGGPKKGKGRSEKESLNSEKLDNDDDLDGDNENGDDDKDDDDDEDESSEMSDGSIDEEDYARRLFGSKSLSEMSPNADASVSTKEKKASEHSDEEASVDTAHSMFDSIPQEVPITIEIYYPLGTNNNFDKKEKETDFWARLLGVGGSNSSEGGSGRGIYVGKNSTHKLKMLKDDLYRMVTNAKHLLHIALRAVYMDFYYTASADETHAVEGAWELIASEIMSKCHWNLRHIQDQNEDIENSNINIPTTEISIILDNVYKMDFLTTLIGIPISSGIMISGDKSSENQLIVQRNLSVLTWSTVIFSKAMIIKVKKSPVVISHIQKIEVDEEKEIDGPDYEETEGPDYEEIEEEEEEEGEATEFKGPVIIEKDFEEFVDKNPLLKVIFWQSGDTTGVVALDHSRNEIMFAQESCPIIQKSLIRALRFLQPPEKSLYIQLYLFSKLRYSRLLHKSTRTFHGILTFIDPNDKNDTDDVYTSDFDVGSVVDIASLTSSLAKLEKSASLNSFR